MIGREHKLSISHRMLRDLLNRQGFMVGRRHTATLIKRMGIEALYRKPNTSRRHPRYTVYPYLLRGLSTSAPLWDGKGCWRDNVFVECIWRSVKYEEVYLKGYASVSEAHQGIERYFEFYNTLRPHSSWTKLHWATLQPLAVAA